MKNGLTSEKELKVLKYLLSDKDTEIPLSPIEQMLLDIREVREERQEVEYVN